MSKGWADDDVPFGQHYRPPISDFERIAAAVRDAGQEGLSEGEILNCVPFATLAKLKTGIQGAQRLGLIARREDGVFVAQAPGRTPQCPTREQVMTLVRQYALARITANATVPGRRASATVIELHARDVAEVQRLESEIAAALMAAGLG
jgi:hypothetical protein